MAKKCDENCFSCIYDDCIMNGITARDRKEIRDRDSRYFDAIESDIGCVIKGRKQRKKHRGRTILAM